MSDYSKGHYWVFASPCSQNPPLCGAIHGSPFWEIAHIHPFERGRKEHIRYAGRTMPLEDFVGKIGPRIPDPPDQPEIPDDWDRTHYTMYAEYDG